MADEQRDTASEVSATGTVHGDPIPRPQVDVTCLRLMRKLRQINKDRNGYVVPFYQAALAAEQKWSIEREQWEDEVEDIISEWREHGFDYEAGRLAGNLLKNPRVARPGQYKHRILVPGRHEYITFSGFDAQDPGFRTEGDIPDSDSDNDDEAGFEDSVVGRGSNHGNQDDTAGGHFGITEQESLRFFGLSTPLIDLDLAHKTMANTTAIDPQRFIYPAQSTAFQVSCSCSQVLTPSLNLGSSEPTHDWMPKYVPVEHLLSHFRTMHREHFSDLPTLLAEHGQGLTVPCLNRWMISGHNGAVLMRYYRAASDWEELVKGQGTDASKQATARTIKSSSLPANAYRFRWPGPDKPPMVVFCTKPDCPLQAFSKHPLHRDRAIAHFETHNLHLNDAYHVMALFGFRVIDDSFNSAPQVSHESDEPSEPKRHNVTANPIQPSKKTPTVSLAYRSKNQKTRRDNGRDFKNSARCYQCFTLHNACNMARPSCGTCRDSGKQCVYADMAEANTDTANAWDENGNQQSQRISDEDRDTSLYCFCRNVEHGPMIGCDNEQCPYEWFHWACVGLKSEVQGEWYCPVCATAAASKGNPSGLDEQVK